MALLVGSPLQLIASVPPVTRAFTATTVVFSLLYLWMQWQSEDGRPIPYLTLVPGSSLFYPWTFLTSVFVETSIIELIVSLIFVPASLRYLERLWGAAETVKFIVATVTVSNIIAFALNWLEFIVLRNADLFLYGMEYHGQMALQIGILVAFTQLIPEHHVHVLGVIKARVKTLPMAYVTFSTVMGILGFQCPYIVIQFGFLVSWVWLRFYKKNIGDTLGGGYSYGDRSETFALVNWFPPFVRTPVGLLGNVVYIYASRFHLIPTGGADVEANGFLPGNARAEAERRRQMALKALDQRVANTSSPSGAKPPAARTDSLSSKGEAVENAEEEDIGQSR
ncbi:eukaryotic integral membrane protein [Amylostereum chailletii]|nr:eukaryotic integral membrane protein [Amylostereum chailletii]